MTYAFQSNAFQSNSFQENVGNIAGSCSLTFGNEANLGSWNQHDTGTILSPGLRGNFGWLEKLNRKIPAQIVIGDLAGTAASTFGEGSSVLVGAGALAAVSAISITPAAPLSANGALAGQANITISLQASVGIAGTANITLIATGAITGTAPIAGASELGFQKTMTVPLSAASRPGQVDLSLSASAAISFFGARGVADPIDAYKTKFVSNWFSSLRPRVETTSAHVASMTFSLAGTLASPGSLAGSADMLFGGTDAMRATGALAGTAALSFAPTLDNPPIGSTSGTASMTFGAIVGAAGAAAGEADVTITPTATLIGTGGLSASTPMTFGGVAALTPTGMFGTATMSFSLQMGERRQGLFKVLRQGMSIYGAQAAEILTPKIYRATQLVANGQLLITFTPAATIQASGNLSGTCTLSMGATARGDGAETGTADIQFIVLGLPRADGALAGSSDLVISSTTSELTNQVALQGVVSLQFSSIANVRKHGNWTPDSPKGGNWNKQNRKSGGWTKVAPDTEDNWVKETGT